MDTLPSTSSSDTPNKSTPGTQPYPFPVDPTSRSIAEELGYSGTPGCTFTDEDLQEAIDTTRECNLEFLMSGESRHPVAVMCTTHGWKGDLR